MIQDNKYLMHYTAEEGKVIVRKDRGEKFHYSKDIWVGKLDSIDNYEEIPETEAKEINQLEQEV